MQRRGATSGDNFQMYLNSNTSRTRRTSTRDLNLKGKDKKGRRRQACSYRTTRGSGWPGRDFGSAVGWRRLLSLLRRR